MEVGKVVRLAELDPNLGGLIRAKVHLLDHRAWRVEKAFQDQPLALMQPCLVDSLPIVGYGP